MGKEKQATDSNSAIKRCECGETYRQLSYTNERTFCRWTVVECNNMRHACVCAWPKTRSTKHIHSASSFSVAQNEWNSVSFRAYGCLARWALFHSKLSGFFFYSLHFNHFISVFQQQIRIDFISNYFLNTWNLQYWWNPANDKRKKIAILEKRYYRCQCFIFFLPNKLSNRL